MHNTCYSSTLSLRCKGSPSFSYDGYSNFLNDGIGTRNPIHPPTSSCCSCCTNSIYRAAPLNPSILYGLRQSTLIQWSTCKRLILGVGDRYYYRFPVYDVDRSWDYGNSYSFKERSVSSRRGKWRKGKFGCMVSEDMDNVEVMLSLLTEVSEECLCVRERKGSSYRKVQIEKKENSGKKKNVGSGLLESNSRCEFESVKIQPKGENYRRKEDRERKEKEILSRGENRRVRKEGSSCSSYYSVSSSGDVESDNEVRVKNEEGFVGESWSRYNGDLRKSDEIVEEGHERENSAVGSYKLSSGLEYDWRKKSEKKLNEISTEQSESSKNLSQNNSRLVEVHESDYVKTSASHKQSDKREERSNFLVNIDEGRRKQFKSTSQQVSGESESRMKYKRFGDREENLGAAVSLVEKRENEHHKTDARITKQDESRWKSQQLDETSEIQEIGFKGTSISQGTKDQHYQESLPVTGKMDSRRKSELLTETSHTHDADIVNTSTSKRKSDTRMKKQEARSDIVLSSSSEERDQRSQTGHKETRLMESSRKSQDFTNTQRASENRKSSQEIHSTVEEIRKIRTLTDERVLEIGSGKEDRMLTKASSFSGGFSKEASSSSLSSSHLKPHARVQEINVDEEDNRNLQTMVIAPSSQLVERGPYILSPARSHAESQPWQSEIHGGARRDVAYGITSHKDALVSADRMQKSSDQFIGEFAEKVKHEFSTSETQIGMKSSETTMVSLGQKSQHGSGDSESKKHESRGSSRSSGTKGPSDEIWDVTDPSIVGPPKTEVLSGTTTTTTTTTSESAVSKRTGRSLWNIIGDIIRLRWTPRSDSHNSAAKSGGKSSPNQSVSSETWFSGHEQEENNDDNGKEQTNDPVEAESFGQQKVGKVTAKSPEGSSSRSSKDKIRHAGVDKLSSSSILESGSASKSISSASGDENIGLKEDRKNFLSSTSGTAVLESSVLLPGGPTKSPVVEEISEAGQTEEISGTGAKEGELKRRKFQRANQVMKDRFDDWEEAYILESEQRKIDEMFMREALLEAKKAADVWEVPVGAVLVQHGKIIARGYNLVEELRDSTAHAEMICIREASSVLRTWRLSETTLYVTLEPCPMCAGAILQARVDTVVWGAPNKLLGADGSWIRLFPNGSGGGNDLELRDKPAAPVHPFHPKITIRRGVLASECSDEMQQFFQLRRRKKDKKEDTSPSSPQPSCLPVSHHPSKLLTKMHDAFHLMFCL